MTQSPFQLYVVQTKYDIVFLFYFNISSDIKKKVFPDLMLDDIIYIEILKNKSEASNFKSFSSRGIIEITFF